MKTKGVKIKKIAMFLLINIFILLMTLSFAYANNFTNTTNNSIDNDSDGYNITVDCNDNNSNIFINLSGYADFDLDNYTTGNEEIICTNGTLPITYKLIQNPEDCNDFNASINPGVEEIFFNGVDDDCSSSTSDEILFEITTTKNEYVIGEQASFTINAQNNSDVNISFIVPNNYFNYEAQFINQTYPITEDISSTKKHGQYNILGTLGYKGYVLEIEKVFTVRNSIEIEIDGEIKINNKEVLELDADASGGFGNYFVYNWWFGDGDTAAGKSITHTYDTPGEYTLIVQAKDIEDNSKNETIKVKVYRLYQLKVIALDRTTDSPIKGVTINFGSGTLTSGNDGTVYFKERKGDYDLLAYIDGYKSYEGYGYTLDKNSTLTIKLQRIDSDTPIISLKEKTIFSKNGNATIKFIVTDTSKVDCSVYTSSDSNWWNLEAEIKEINTSNEQSVEIITEEKELNFKIECVDVEENIALSEEGKIKPEAESAKVPQDLQSLTDSLVIAKNSIKNFGAKEREVYSILELDTILKAAERFSQNYQRDVESIENPRCPGIHCDLTENARQNRIDELTQKTKDAIDIVPISISVTNFDEYVKYPTKLEIESAIKDYFEIKDTVLTKKQLKKLVEQNSLLQTKITVSTKAYNVEIEYINGEKKKLTIVKKDIEIYDNDGAALGSKNYKLFEYIPNEILRKSKAEFTGNVDSLSETIHELSLKQKSLAYYLDGFISSNEVKSTNTLLFSTNVQSNSLISGFAFLSADTLKDINYFYFVITLLLAIVLGRLGVMLGWFDKIGVGKIIEKISSKLATRDYHSMMMLVNDAEDYMATGDLQKASLVYKEIKLVYEELSAAAKKKVYDKIRELCEKLDEDYIKNLVETAKQDIIKKDIRHAEKIYAAMQKVYKRLRESSQKLFENDINEIYSKLSKKDA